MNTQVMLLRSDVDDSHSHVVTLPPGLGAAQAAHLAGELIAQAQRANPDFTWDDDVAPALAAHGFATVPHVLGPTWDSPAE
ncbi:hypothetical protein EV699_11453 [Plasticicumulans lactativorans]|uniref:Uncharacterized protein n=1 Tax=Plasticicumulans lactativorans TaxID=1133106 RepID=A0A4R2L8A0_9GAMM|nr:hypothetical protein [Plasticicumulans lactativorans]TCO80409.1 hypothetical protein EV699_11453 [Plasticicumulans lactativorans]